jgi:hypothetical protein
MLQMTYKNPMQQRHPLEPSILTAGSMAAGLDLSESNLLERAAFNQKLNSILLCLFGLTKDLGEDPVTRKTLYQSLLKRKVPHFMGFFLLVNAILFQSVSIYAVVINRDHSHASQMQDAADVGQACQYAGALALFLGSI